MLFSRETDSEPALNPVIRTESAPLLLIHASQAPPLYVAPEIEVNYSELLPGAARAGALDPIEKSGGSSDRNPIFSCFVWSKR